MDFMKPTLTSLLNLALTGCSNTSLTGESQGNGRN